MSPPPPNISFNRKVFLRARTVSMPDNCLYKSAEMEVLKSNGLTAVICSEIAEMPVRLWHSATKSKSYLARELDASLIR